MSRILISVFPLLGHVNPMFHVGAYLKKSGHDVIFNTSSVLKDRVEERGLSFVPHEGNADLDYRRFLEEFPELKTTAPGMPLLSFYFKHVLGDRIPAQYNLVRRVIEQERIELLITDIFFLGSLPLLLGPREARPPIISCGVLAPLWRDPAHGRIHPPDDSPEGKIIIEKENRAVDEGFLDASRYIDHILSQFNVAVPGGFWPETPYVLPDLLMQFSGEAFEFPVTAERPNLRFVGPIVEPMDAAAPLPSWIRDLDPAKPVIFITQGTLANRDFEQILNPALKGLADEDVQVVATAGGGDISGIVRAPNARIESYIDYRAILPKVDVFVTNGGLNGVQHALSLGVPIVTSGVSEDKPRVNTRIAWRRVGINLASASPTAEEIRDAVKEVLANPIYRQNAKEMRVQFSRYDALREISEAAENLIAANRQSVKERKNNSSISSLGLIS